MTSWWCIKDNDYRIKNYFDTFGFVVIRGFIDSKDRKSILENYKGAAYFVPGNHDWWNTTNFNKGKQKLQMEESFIEQNLALNKSISNTKNVFLPQHGSPGPSVVEMNDNKICVVFMDTDWLLLLDEKRTPKINQEQEKIFYLKFS